MIVIYGIKEKLLPMRGKISDALQACLQAELGMPEDKRAHRFVPLDRENVYFPAGRSDAYTVIEINMMSGRKKETQKALIKAVFHRLENDVGLSPIDVEITIKEQEPFQWGFRGMTGDEAKNLNYKVDV